MIVVAAPPAGFDPAGIFVQHAAGIGLPIPGDWILQGGAVGLLTGVALMIFLGWLVPGRTYRALERDRDFWREAALKSLGQTDALLPSAQITTEVTRALAGATAPDPPAADAQGAP